MKFPPNAIYNEYKFDPTTSIPDLSNRVIIVTGGNNGIGLRTVLRLSEHNPARLYLAARSRAKYDAALTTLEEANPSIAKCLSFLELDLASLSSVKAAATTVLSRESRLDLLINNAGIMAVPAALSQDGYEVQFATNFLGHALLTNLLMPLLTKTAKSNLLNVSPASVRVVHVSSSAGYAGLTPSQMSWPAQRGERSDLGEFPRYAVSKLAQILWTKQSAQHWKEHSVVHVVVDPGRVNTGLLDGFMGRTSKFNIWHLVQNVFDTFAGKLDVEQGSWTSLWAATSDQVTSGSLYEPVGMQAFGDAKCKDEKLGRELWEWTEGELKGWMA